MNTTTTTDYAAATAETLYRQLVLPVKAVRARLGAAADYEPAVIAHHTGKVVPALTKASSQVAAHRSRLDRKAAKNSRKTMPVAVRRNRETALADAIATVDGIHEALTTATRSLAC